MYRRLSNLRMSRLRNRSIAIKRLDYGALRRLDPPTVHAAAFSLFFHNPQQVWDLGDHSTNRICVGPLDDLFELCQPQAADDDFLFFGCTDLTPIELDLDLLFLRNILLRHSLHLLYCPAAQSGDLFRTFHTRERIEGCANDVMRIVRTETFGKNVAHTNCIHHGSHGASGYNPCTF